MSDPISGALRKQQHPPGAQMPAVINRLLTQALAHFSYREMVETTLREALTMVGGKRGFVSTIDQDTGVLRVIATAGPGWTDDQRRIRLQPHNETERGITGFVAITGKPYVAGSVRNDPHYIEHFADVESEIAVPYFDAEGRTRGVLNVDSDRSNAFRPEHGEILTTFANIVATASAFEEHRSRERMLVAVGLDLAATVEIEPLVQRVVDVAADVLRCEGCSAFLLDEQTQMLRLRASSGPLREQVGQAVYALGEGLTGTVGQTGESIRLEDPRQDPRWVGRYTEFVPDDLGAFLAVPIVGRDHILGVIRAVRPRTAPAWFRARFTENDERVLRTLASQLGIAIENLRAFNQLVRSERMAAWGELSAKSAHMIGNRTFAIKGDLNELRYLVEHSDNRDLEELKQEATALVASMERGVFRLEEILREFRDFVMATHITLNEADLSGLVHEVIQETFPRRSVVQLREEYPDGPILLRCDAGRLKRAFSELVENAVSFMPDGGTLEVAASLVPSGGAPPVRLAANRRYASVLFRDTGPGVQPEVKSKIFNPFFSSRVKGMGLGLSIVKGIVDAHHGFIREDGVAGSGANFRVYLPLPDVRDATR